MVDVYGHHGFRPKRMCHAKQYRGVKSAAVRNGQRGLGTRWWDAMLAQPLLERPAQRQEAAGARVHRISEKSGQLLYR